MANKKRLIDRNEIFPNGTFFASAEDPLKSLDELINRIWSIPTVDAVEVVHARWVWDVESHGDPMYGIDEDYGYRCSECQVWADEYGVDGDIYEEPPTHILHYCPNCGAKMDGGNEDV